MKNFIFIGAFFYIGLIISDSMITNDKWYKEYFAHETNIGKIIGFKNLTADLLWIDAIQYIGDSKNAKEGYKKFPKIVKRIINVDRNFIYAYQSGSVILMCVLKNTQEAINILKEGIKYNPHYGQFHLYLGAFTYLNIENYSKTIELLEYAVYKLEDHPYILERLLGNLYLKVGEMEKAKKLWWWLLSYSKDQGSREYAKNKLKKFGYWFE